MLVSHRKQFIYTKTAKTAGTSVESYFEQYCMPEGMWVESHQREEYTSQSGIIGYRGPANKGKQTWVNHMPASIIKQKLGSNTWNSYFKFCVIRNPYDKLVSGFYHFKNVSKPQNLPDRIKLNIKRSFGVGDPIHLAQGEDDIYCFRDWLKKGGAILDRDKYIIDNEICIDYFIKFEELQEGIRHVCQELDIPFEPDRIRKLKSNQRKKKFALKDFYDPETIKIVKAKYALEIEKFQYALPV